MNDLTIPATLEQSVPETNTAVMILNADTMKALYAFADMMSKSVISVPEHLRGKPSDCLAIAMQAAQWGMNPFAVAQKTHVVSGRLGYEAQLVNAVLTESGAIVGHPHYEYRGEGQKLECRVGCTLRGDTEVTWGEWYCIADVKTKNSPLWGTNPKQQLGYLQLKFWARLYAPGPVLGVYTVDELEDTPPAVTARGPRRKSEGAPAPMVERVDAPAATAGGTTAGANPETGEVPPPPPAPTPQASTANGAIKGNEIAYLRNKLKSQGVSEQAVCDRFQVAGIEHLSREQFDTIKAELIANG